MVDTNNNAVSTYSSSEGTFSISVRNDAGVALPAVVGLGSGVFFLVAIEILVRLGAINRFIVPLPSEVPYPTHMEPNLIVEFYSR